MSNELPTLGIQKAVYSRLTADTTLMALIQGVFDFVPDNKPFPFIRIGDPEFADWSSHTFDGAQGTYQIDIWSRPTARGKAEALTLAEHVKRILHRAPLSVTGYATCSFRFDQASCIVDPDAVTYHGIVRFKFLMGGI